MVRAFISLAELLRQGRIDYESVCGLSDKDRKHFFEKSEKYRVSPVDVSFILEPITNKLYPSKPLEAVSLDDFSDCHMHVVRLGMGYQLYFSPRGNTSRILRESL